MGRPRAFDEAEAVRAAAVLFAELGYEGTSVDDLVQRLGVHRGSLYKVFGSKRGLYLAALRQHLDQEVRPAAAAIGEARTLAAALARAAAGFDGGAAAGLLLSAAVEQAPVDPPTAALVAEGLGELETALARVAGATGAAGAAGAAGVAGAVDDGLVAALAAAVIGLRVRDRALGGDASAGAVSALAERVDG